VSPATSRLALLEEARARSVLVVGDAILDLDVHAVALGLSLETPTLKARKLRVEPRFGGAGLVVRNLLALGARAVFLTALGDDAVSDHYARWSEPGLEQDFVVAHGRHNTVKERYWIRRAESSGPEATYKALQLDALDDAPIAPGVEQAVLARAEARMGEVDTVVFADYRHGLLTPSLIEQLVALARRAGRATFADSQVSEHGPNHDRYRGVDCVTLNRLEAERLAPGFTVDETGLRRLEERLVPARVVVKLGAAGCLARVDGEAIRFAPPPVTPVDPCGAGDAFLAALALGDPRRPLESLENAVTWGALATTVHGTAPADRAALVRLLEPDGHERG